MEVKEPTMNSEDDASVAKHRASAATLDDVAGLLLGIRDALTSHQAELLDTEAACAMLGVSRSTLDRKRSKVEVSEPVILAGSITRWRRRELVR